MEKFTKPFFAKTVASSTISPEVLFPARNEPPWTQMIAGRSVTVSPVGS